MVLALNISTVEDKIFVLISQNVKNTCYIMSLIINKKYNLLFIPDKLLARGKKDALPIYQFLTSFLLQSAWLKPSRMVLCPIHWVKTLQLCPGLSPSPWNR